MRYKSIFSISILSSLLFLGEDSLAQSSYQNTTQNKNFKYAQSLLSDAKDGLYASIELDKGSILLELYYQTVPLTVTSFVGLATGKFSEHVTRKGHFFDGLTFHRVVDNFVIQGGDPTGSGSGGPGYNFDNEIVSNLNYNQAGVLAMANAGPDTNGSQFFITLSPTPHLQGAYSIFGNVIFGLDLVKKVREGDKIRSISVIPKGTDAESYLDSVNWNSFEELKSKKEEDKKNAQSEKKNIILLELTNNKDFLRTKDNLFYTLLTQGKGETIKNGDNVKLHYELKLYGDDKILDSSYSRGQTLNIEVGSNTVIRGWELILLELKEGDKARVIIPPELAYGEDGIVPAIPPNAFLDFIIEVVKVN